MENQILVIGNGKTGRRVADRLTQLNRKHKVVSRSSATAFDWTDASTWPAALDGSTQVYITFQPDLAVPGAVDIIKAFVDTAKQVGVKQLILLSGRGEQEAQDSEQIIINSGLDWTIIRASWFMQNFSESFFLDGVITGEVVVPQVKAAEPFVDADDIADVVVQALTNSAHNYQVYELTGPDLLTFEEAFAIIASTINRTILFQEIPMIDYIAALRSYHMPEDHIWLISYLFSEVLDGRNESVVNDIEKVLGRKATSFTDYALKAHQSGSWNV